MKISFAEQWLKTIESYKDPITRYVRSFKYGISELDSAKSDVKIKKKNAKQISPDEMAGKLQSLSKQASLLKSEKEGIIFHEENQACYDKMNELAQEYAKLAGKPEYKDNFKNLSRHAGKYLSDAKKFLNAHKPHAHKHGHKHKVGHNETNKLLYTDSSNIAATTSTQSAPLTTVAK